MHLSFVVRKCHEKPECAIETGNDRAMQKDTASHTSQEFRMKEERENLLDAVVRRQIFEHEDGMGFNMFMPLAP